MTVAEQEKCLLQKRLYLTGGRLFRYYFDVYLFAGIAVALVIALGYIPRHFLAALVLLIFPLCAIRAFVIKNRQLVLREIETALSKEQNHEVVRDVLRQLGWSIKVNNKGFIEAYTTNYGFSTSTGQMMSILITDNKIVFNSINNPDAYGSRVITWGQNRRNRKEFQSLFEHLAIQRIYQ